MIIRRGAKYPESFACRVPPVRAGDIAVGSDNLSDWGRVGRPSLPCRILATRPAGSRHFGSWRSYGNDGTDVAGIGPTGGTTGSFLSRVCPAAGPGYREHCEGGRRWAGL